MSINKLLSILTVSLLVGGLPIIIIFGSGGVLENIGLKKELLLLQAQSKKAISDIGVLKKHLSLVKGSEAYRKSLLRSVGVFEKGDSLVLGISEESQAENNRSVSREQDSSILFYSIILIVILSVLAYYTYRRIRSDP